jgi:predicted DsbA family dithiol-disulfide isomerase
MSNAPAALKAPSVAPNTIQLWSDLLCPFAYVALVRLRRARTALDLDGVVAIEHRTFPLELFNGPHPRRGTDTEAVGLGQIEPEAQFRVWTGPEDQYPHTVLLAAEAVHAANTLSLAAGEALDLALRRAFWTDSRSISHRAAILDIAGELAGPPVDPTAIAIALDDGRHRADVMADFAIAQTDAIDGSPTLRLADGTSVTNPGIEVHWQGPWAAGFPVVDKHDASVFDDLLRRAVAGAA